jgi:hypothetical protein
MEKITNSIIVITGIIWLLWDIVIAITGNETISEKLHRWAKDCSATIPFSFGFLCGHWFFKEPGHLTIWTYLIILSTFTILTIDIVKFNKFGKGVSVRIYRKDKIMSGVFVIGIIFGYFFF